MLSNVVLLNVIVLSIAKLCSVSCSVFFSRVLNLQEPRESILALNASLYSSGKFVFNLIARHIERITSGR